MAHLMGGRRRVWKDQEPHLFSDDDDDDKDKEKDECKLHATPDGR